MTDILASLTAALEGRYEIERELGMGGMATVYLARELKHQRHVAIKVFRPEVASALGGDRFLREIDIVAQIEHPHILTLIDSGDADGILYFVMPYVSGDSLRTRLAGEGQLPVRDVIRLMRDVADGLAEAHRHGLIHRDIKPDNVMMSGNHAVVMDFGVAKAVTSATGEHHVTTAGITLGTPAYMSPEQAAADPDIDHRTDVYALGVLAYELLTGRPPLSGGSPAQVLAAHISKVPDPVSDHRPETPAALEALIMRCLEKQPEDRWAEMEEIVRQLELIATPSGGVPSMRISGATKAGGRLKLGPRTVAAAVVVLVLAGSLVMVQRRSAATRSLVAEVQAAVDVGDLDAAYVLLEASGRSLGEGPFEAIAGAVGGSVTLNSTPEGAVVSLARIESGLDSTFGAVDLGATPIPDVTLVAGEYQLSWVADGFDPLEMNVRVEPGLVTSLGAELVDQAWGVGDVVAVGSGLVRGPIAERFEDVEIPPFLIGRVEVTNERFMEFVSAGGYRSPEYWPESMLIDGVRTPWEEAIGQFVDRTELPGPRNWSGGTFLAGSANQPVTGVTWYEASAFASWVGAELPSMAQWWRAALADGGGRFPWGDDLRGIDDRSNFGGVGTSEAGRFDFGTSAFGVHDMAGNVKEWIAGDPADESFTVLGGSWLSPEYMFDTPNLESYGPSYQNEEIGFRLVRARPAR